MPFTPGGKVTTADATANYIAGTRANADKWKRRVLSPRRLFNATPDASEQAFIEKLNEAFAAHSYAHGLAGVDMNLVAANIEKSGAQSYATNTANKAPKFENALKKGLLEAVYNLREQVFQQHPGSSDSAKEARMVAFRRGMRDLRGKFRARS